MDCDQPHPSPSHRFENQSSGTQNNAVGGPLNVHNGSGNQFNQSHFSGNVYFSPGDRPLVDRILESLAFREMDHRQDDISPAAEGTCGWLVDQQTYEQWESATRGLLWVKGNPGTGKSTMIRYALQYAEQNGDSWTLLLSFFCHNRGVDLQKTEFGLYRSLLNQLLREAPESCSSVLELVRDMDHRHGPGKWEWNLPRVRTQVNCCIGQVLRSRPVRLFVDALDECGEDAAVAIVDNLKTALRMPPSTNPFLVCFSCRPYPVLAHRSEWEVNMERHNEHDILVYTRGRLASNSISESSLAVLITKRARGVFMWARVVTDRVIQRHRKRRGLEWLLSEVESTAPDLEDLYSQAADSMDEEGLKLCKWVAFARDPLSLAEMRWAIWIGEDWDPESLRQRSLPHGHSEDDIKVLSCGLVEVTSPGHTVQFIHKSVKEFIIDGCLGRYRARESGAVNNRCFDICLRYCIADPHEDSRYLLDGHERGDPGKMSWEHHQFQGHAGQSMLWYLRQADDTFAVSQDSLGLLSEHLPRLERLLQAHLDESVLQDMGGSSRASADFGWSGISLLHVLALTGASRALESVLGHGTMFRRGEIKLNPAWKKLVQKGIDARDSKGKTPLYWAAAMGHGRIVWLLYSYGASINIPGIPGTSSIETPLMVATQYGHVSTVQTLLEAGARVHSYHPYCTQELHEAVYRGHEEVVKLLVEEWKVLIDPEDEGGNTPLLLAAGTGHADILRYLVTSGANLCHTNAEGRTVLHYAARRQDVDMLSWLLERLTGPGQINQGDVNGVTPLMAACMSRSDTSRGPDVIEILLKHGATFEQKDGHGNTALALNHARSGLSTVEALLARGADINAQDLSGRTPITALAKNTLTSIEFEQVIGRTQPEEATKTARQALDATPQDSPNRAALLNKLGVRLAGKFWRTGAMTDLEDAIKTARQALDATPKDHPSQAALFNILPIMRLPLCVQDIIRMVPKKDITFSTSNDTTILNRAKIYLEDHTVSEWYWHPFKAPMRNLEEGKCRLHYKLYGYSRSVDVPENTPDILAGILENLSDHPDERHRCAPTCRALTWSTSLLGVLSAFYSHFSSGSHPVANSRQEQQSQSSRQGAAEDSIGLFNLPAGTNADGADGRVFERRIVPFAVQGWRKTLEATEVDVSENNDRKFFNDLLRFQRKHRHFILNLLSPWRFSDCKSVRFRKSRFNTKDTVRIVSDKDPKLPGSYPPITAGEYEPCPSDKDIPLIESSEFALFLTSCGLDCWLCWVGCPHEALLMLESGDHLARIPKKRGGFLKDDRQDSAFGLQAVYQLSVLGVGVYHVISFAVTIVFWIYWQTLNPDDVQSAAVPITLWAAFASLFWVLQSQLKGLI